MNLVQLVHGGGEIGCGVTSELLAKLNLGSDVDAIADVSDILTKQESALMCFGEGANLANDGWARWIHMSVDVDTGTRYLNLSNDDDKDYDPTQEYLNEEPTRCAEIWGRMIALFGGELSTDIKRDSNGDVEKFFIDAHIPVSALSDIMTTKQFQYVMKNCQFSSLQEYKDVLGRYDSAKNNA